MVNFWDFFKDSNLQNCVIYGEIRHGFWQQSLRFLEAIDKNNVTLMIHNKRCIQQNWADVQNSCWHFCNHIRSYCPGIDEVLTAKPLPAHQRDPLLASREAPEEKVRISTKFCVKIHHFWIYARSASKNCIYLHAIKHPVCRVDVHLSY